MDKKSYRNLLKSKRPLNALQTLTSSIYKKQETDPLNSIINVMSKLETGEGIVIQYIIRSANKSWHKKASKTVSEAYQKSSVSQALNTSIVQKGIFLLGDLVKSAKPPTPEERQNKIENPPRLTAMEEDMLKGIEEKNSKAGLDVNLRIIISAKNKGKAQIYLDNMASAFSQYNYYEYGNSFKDKISRGKQPRLINNFIYRRFNPNIKFLLNTEELASMFHLPLKTAETPNILWLTAKQASAPINIPDEGIILGENSYRGVTKEIKIGRASCRERV